MSDCKRVYRFGTDAQGTCVTEGDKSMNFVLGGKGANLAEMSRIGLPVPGGFTITCQTCVEYSGAGNVWPEGALDEIVAAEADLEARCGKKLGDASDPLLVSVRSGAPFSMPGMMDTVLNLGLNDDSVQGLIVQTQNPRFAWDSYRRFIQMFSNVVMGVDADLFENALTQARLVAGARVDSELSAEDLQELVETFKSIFSDNVEAALYPELEVADGKPVFPHDPELQLRLAIQAVFGSWMNERACIYRKQHGISDELGTAVNVQAMAFGNKGETSATGVAFTRNPADGTKEFYGDFLVNAQGEDVVAGIRNTEPIADLKATPGLESAGEELERVFLTLEDHYRDMCDIEFTIEQGKLWMLQTRVGKRTATAALRIAIEMVEEGLITREEAVSRIDPAQLDQLLHPQFDASKKYEALASGLNASPGAAVGEIVFSSDDAVARANEGHKVILVRWETNPDDLKGMVAAEGILTSHGGKTSHAAVIARGMGTPCVCGVERFHIDAAEKVVRIEGSDRVLHEGDVISIDGTQGIFVDGAVDLVSAELTGDLDTILSWADEIRLDETCGHANHVRVNADNPEDAALALEFGAEAIGLCRTEHMFLGDRKNIIQSFILSDDEAVKQQALADLLKVQTEDFLAMFKTMSGRDVVVRLLDPPLHEFLDNPRELEAAITDKTGLVTIMYANNEIGTIQPIPEIGEICKKHGVWFHTDAVQAVGNVPINVKEQNIDMLSLSGHKFHGPKGVGVLYIKKGIILPNLIDGGAQERGRRAGTENVASIVGLSVALENAINTMDEKNAKLRRMQDKLITELSKIDRSHLNGDRYHRLPGNVNFSFEGVEGESMLLMLDLKGVCASSGSACTSGSLDPSHVLLAIGLKHEVAHGSLRLSFSDVNDESDADYIIEVLPKIIDRLRAMSPLWERIIKA